MEALKESLAREKARRSLMTYEDIQAGSPDFPLKVAALA
jgi:hypothetical protein